MQPPKPSSVLQAALLCVALCPTVIAGCLTGCGSTPEEKIKSAATIARFCAFNAASAYMIEAEDKVVARANLRQVANDYRALYSVEQVRIADVALMAAKLPTQKLKSGYGRLAIINGQLFLVTWSSSSELTDADAKPAAKAFYEGIEMEIGPPEVIQRANAPSVPVFSPTN